MGKLSREAIEALNSIREEYGESVVNELTKDINFDTTTVHQYHLDLLNILYLDNDAEYVLNSNAKRPFGNSDIDDDIREIIGFPANDSQINDILESIPKITKALFKNPELSLNDLIGRTINEY